MKFTLRSCVAVSAAVLLASCANPVEADNSIVDKMYTYIEHTPCIRLYTRDGLTGCGTARDFNEGSLRSVATQAEVRAL
jgi:hypothetical protein